MIKKLLSDFFNLIFQKENNADYNWYEIILITLFLIFIISMLII